MGTEQGISAIRVGQDANSKPPLVTERHTRLARIRGGAIFTAPVFMSLKSCDFVDISVLLKQEKPLESLDSRGFIWRRRRDSNW